MMRGRVAGRVRVVGAGAGLLLLALAAAACSGSGGGGAAAAASSTAASASGSSTSATMEPSPVPSTAPSTAPATATATATAIDPAEFGSVVDNPFLPFLPGMVWRYRGSSDEGPSVETVTVTSATGQILGVPAVVVHDVASSNGAVIEDTYDWYAQDKAGNVWYFGEDTKTLHNGQVTSREGSWQAGVKGAVAGIVMEAHPAVGDRYRQEFYAGQAEDRAEVLSTSASVSVPLGAFRNLVETADTSPLEPKVIEHKYFARGIGSVREVDVRGGSDQLQLVSFHRP